MDDLIVSAADDYMFAVVNASMREQDIAHLRTLDIEVIEIDRSLIAIQGPSAEAIVSTVTPEAAELKFMETRLLDIMGSECRVSRLGYTGEDGYEISLPNDRAVEITRKFLEHPDLEMAGLGARDSLRLEAGLCLYVSGGGPIELGHAETPPRGRRLSGCRPYSARIERRSVPQTGWH